jgi:8-oxo-dGTP diphosphatase
MTDQTGKLGHDSPESQGDEAAFLAAYVEQVYPKPSVTVDLVVFTVTHTGLQVLLIKRGGHPFKGHWALPGGFVDVKEGRDDQGEDVEQAAHRELEEETSLPRGSLFLEQLYTFGRAGRDPRGRVISVAYLSLIPPDKMGAVKAADDATDARWFSVEHDVPGLDLAFDHAEILEMGVLRIRGKLDYTDIAFELVPPTFTQADLRSVHQAVQGCQYSVANFRRRFRRLQTDGWIEQLSETKATGAHPAKLFKFARR